MYGGTSEMFEDEFEDFEGDFEGDFEAEMEGDFEDEYEAEMAMEGDFEGDFESGLEGEKPFDDDEELELAAELLEVSDDEELDQFLGKVFKRVRRGARRFLRSRVGRRLRGQLRGVARRALPIAGRAVGAAFGGPVGGMIGGRLASRAGRLFGLELEGMSPEDQELEVARRFVRLAGTAAKMAAKAPPSAPPQVANRALAAAARRHAPGLVRGSRPSPRRRPGGRWMRRGNRIILFETGGIEDELEAFADDREVADEEIVDREVRQLLQRLQRRGRRAGVWVLRGRNIVLLGTP